MGELKLIWNNNGKHKSNSCTVSVRECVGEYLCSINSPGEIVGTGSDFSRAKENFSEQLTDYINRLTKFRDQVVETKRAYFEAIETDSTGIPL